MLKRPNAPMPLRTGDCETALTLQNLKVPN
jgi:hypothetical protein